MAKLGFVTLIAAFVGTLAFVGITSHEASAGKPCAHPKLESKLLQDACKKGGQDEAKKVMKAFLKEAKKKKSDLSCASCHSKVGGDYPLKKDAAKMFAEYGGK
jgi:hypothetical protein